MGVSENRESTGRGGTSSVAPLDRLTAADRVVQPDQRGRPSPVRMPAGLAELVAAVRPVTDRELRTGLGLDVFAGLSSRQREDLRGKLWVVRVGRAVVRAAGAGWGDRGCLYPAFLNEATFRLRRRVTERTLCEWTRLHRLLGLHGLVDTRGMHGPRPVDAALLLEFAQRVGRGEPWRVAHRRVLRRALFEGRRWPRSVVSVERMLARGRAMIERRPKHVRQSGYLERGVSQN